MRRKESIPCTNITLRVPVLLVSYLEDLTRHGLHGLTAEDTAHQLIAESLRRKVFEEKTLPRRYAP